MAQPLLAHHDAPLSFQGIQPLNSLSFAVERNARAEDRTGTQPRQLSDRRRALAEITEPLTRDPSTVGEAKFGQLRDLGFSEKAILEVPGVSAFFNYANRLTITWTSLRVNYQSKNETNRTP